VIWSVSVDLDGLGCYAAIHGISLRLDDRAVRAVPELAVRGIRGSSGTYPAPWPATRSASRSCSLRVSLLVGADRDADVLCSQDY